MPYGLLASATLTRPIGPAIEHAKLVLGRLEHVSAGCAQPRARSVDVEREHGHRRSKGLGLAAPAAVGGALQGARNGSSAAQAEDP
jgi:hypothetical protein